MCYRKQLLHPGERHAPKMASSKPVTSARKPQELPRPPPVTTAQGPASPAAPSSTPPHPEGEPNEAAASGPGPSSSAVSLPGAASSVSAPGTAVPPPPPPQQLPAELQPLQEYGHLLNRLAQFLLASMLDQPPRAHWNVLLSPISLVSTLAALVAGSEGPTQEDLCRLLNLQLPEVEAIIEQFKILQTEVDGLRLTQQSLLYGDTLWDLVRGLRPRANVRLGLPKFVLTARNKLRDMLHELGSSRPFDPEQAEFINISGFKGLHTTEILQAVTVEVSEDGNEITRTSALVTEVVSKVAPTTVFLVDRPFLLCGCVRQPLEWHPEIPDNSALL
ncbi:serine protease inhibitor A3N-like isoform X1 [Amblyomma americanum]